MNSTEISFVVEWPGEKDRVAFAQGIEEILPGSRLLYLPLEVSVRDKFREMDLFTAKGSIVPGLGLVGLSPCWQLSSEEVDLPIAVLEDHLCLWDPVEYTTRNPQGEVEFLDISEPYDKPLLEVMCRLVASVGLPFVKAIGVCHSAPWTLSAAERSFWIAAGADVSLVSLPLLAKLARRHEMPLLGLAVPSGEVGVDTCLRLLSMAVESIALRGTHASPVRAE